MLYRIKLEWLTYKANHHRASADMHADAGHLNLDKADEHINKAIKVEAKIRKLRASK